MKELYEELKDIAGDNALNHDNKQVELLCKTVNYLRVQMVMLARDYEDITEGDSLMNTDTVLKQATNMLKR